MSVFTAPVRFKKVITLMTSHKDYSWLDHFFIRAKDIGLLSLVVMIWGVATVWSGIPSKVEASEAKIQSLEKRVQDSEIQYAKIQSGIEYLIKRMDERSGNVYAQRQSN